MSYLKSRGITTETAQAFGCGSGTMKDGPHKGAKCVVFPYYRSMELVGVNRRVTSVAARDKYRFVKGSRKTGYFERLFTGAGGYNYQWWLVEGEINAMSVAQVLQKMDMSGSVRSVSSETDVKRFAPHIAEKRPETVIWVDRAELAEEIWQKYNLTTMWSREGDANELLLKHKLEQFIKPHLTAGNNLFTWSKGGGQQKEETIEECPACHGGGLDLHGSDCIACNGSGDMSLTVDGYYIENMPDGNEPSLAEIERECARAEAEHNASYCDCGIKMPW